MRHLGGEASPSPIDRTLNREILTSKPSFIQGCLRKTVKNGEHKLPPEHKFNGVQYSLNFPQNSGRCRIASARATFQSRMSTTKAIFFSESLGLPGGMYPVGID